MALRAAVGVVAAALPVGLVSAAGQVSRYQLALPAELLQVMTPRHQPHAPRARAAVPQHATAAPTRIVRRSAPARRVAPAFAVTRNVVEPASVPRAAAPEPPAVALAQPALQPRPVDRRPDHVGDPVVGTVPLTDMHAPAAAPTAAAPAPVAEVAIAAPPASAPAPAPAPAAATPSAPSSPTTAKPHHREESDD